MELKRWFIMVVVVLSTVAVRGQDKMFERLSNNKDITIVHISKALLSMVPDMDTGGVNVKGLADKLDRLEIYTSTIQSGIKAMGDEFRVVKKNKSFEPMMSVIHESQTVDFYSQQGDNGQFKDFIMFVNGPENCMVMRIVGIFSMEDIQIMTKCGGN